ncbi:hypothetical protein QJQ45_003918 [Haematococcus lacustris]|nr:hypothetical protein QJQ45_003918 [Haematococcus lacustris]
MDKSSPNDASTGQTLPGLQGLPVELLNAVLSQLDASSLLQVFKTSKFLATALLRVVPTIQLTYPTQHDILGQHVRELAPFLTEVLQNRQQPKLHLTLRPASSLIKAIQQRQTAEPAAAASDAMRCLVARTLGAVLPCEAVDCLTISCYYTSDVGLPWIGEFHLPWEPVFSKALADSFPSLTSLTFKDVSISVGHLATAINHPLLLPRLLHLDLEHAIITHEGPVGRSPFIGSRLQKLSLAGYVSVGAEYAFMSGLLPLPPTLTQLAVTNMNNRDQEGNWSTLAEAVSSLTQLQQLRVINEDRHCNATGLGPTVLLPALAHLPSLHTLVVDEYVVGQEQMRALLALTQITHLEVYRFSGLAPGPVQTGLLVLGSWASSDCSWRQLKVCDIDWVSAAYLPLHSLTHPLQLSELVKGIEEPSIEVLAAAELNLCERNKAGLVLDEDGCMFLSKATVDLLTKLYLSHSHRTAHQPPHPTVASSSSHSGPSTSLASSSSPEGHITPGGPGSSSGQGGQQGSPAGCQALMQRLGQYVKVLRIKEQGPGEARLSSANLQALPALFPHADVVFGKL